MDLDSVGRAVVKPLSRRLSRQGLFGIVHEALLTAKRNGWLGDERPQLLARMIAAHEASPAQLFQDVWAAFETQDKRGGYFVEFGATDGQSLSNTLMLERDLGWTGILAEPNPAWLADLRRHRPKATIVSDCVWSRSGEMLTFLATGAKELGTVGAFADSDRHGKTRADHETISVRSISLNDLLASNNAPRTIDYMSIDTEGSEYEILKAFDFSRWDVRLFSIEHNFTANEKLITALLEAHGYERRFADFSRFDAWFRKRRTA